MKLTLKTKTGKILVNNYSPKDKQWWITAFTAIKGYNAKDLIARFTVDFTNNKGMWKGMVNSNAYKNDELWFKQSDNQYKLILNF